VRVPAGKLIQSTWITKSRIVANEKEVVGVQSPFDCVHTEIAAEGCAAGAGDPEPPGSDGFIELALYCAHPIASTLATAAALTVIHRRSPLFRFV
jgi:hypothetical protein